MELYFVRISEKKKKVYFLKLLETQLLKWDNNCRVKTLTVTYDINQEHH